MTGKKHALSSDLAKADAHVIQPEEYEEIPELTDEWFANAEFHEGGRRVRRGRPPSKNRKKLVTLRIDPEVIDAFKEEGPGWQTRMTDVLRKAASDLPAWAELIHPTKLEEHVSSDVLVPGELIVIKRQLVVGTYVIH
jgi:uncharacterized protein (DUF4415 family)